MTTATPTAYGARVVASGIRIRSGDFVTQLDEMLDTSGDVQASLELVVRCLRLGYLHREQAQARVDSHPGCGSGRHLHGWALRGTGRRAVCRPAVGGPTAGHRMTPPPFLPICPATALTPVQGSASPCGNAVSRMVAVCRRAENRPTRLPTPRQKKCLEASARDTLGSAASFFSGGLSLDHF